MSDETPLKWSGGSDDPEQAVDFADDDEMLDRWNEESPEMELMRARSRMTFRGVVFVAVTAVSLWCVLGFSTLNDFSYFLAPGSGVIDLGDLRARRTGGEERLQVPPDSYVKLRNQVMTYEAESDCCQYFFDPLYNIITRTPRQLPEKNLYRSVEIPGKLAWLVQQRHAFAEDLTAGFDGEGRLVRVDRAPRWRYLYDAYERTIARMPPPDETYIFLDGATPGTYWTYGVAYAAALLLVLVTGLFFVRAVCSFLRLRDTL